MILFSVREEDRYFDVVIEEALSGKDKWILIKRDNDIDEVCGMYDRYEVEDEDFVRELLGV